MIYIEKERKFLEDSLTAINNSSFETIQQKCPYCDCVVRFPIIARERDIKNFEILLKIINEFMINNGITEDLFKKLSCEVNDYLEIQKIINKNLYGILTPDKKYQSSYLRNISIDEYSAWRDFFGEDGILANGVSMAEATKAYQAIGYKCVKLDVKIILDKENRCSLCHGTGTQLNCIDVEQYYEEELDDE